MADTDVIRRRLLLLGQPGQLSWVGRLPIAAEPIGCVGQGPADLVAMPRGLACPDGMREVPLHDYERRLRAAVRAGLIQGQERYVELAEVRRPVADAALEAARAVAREPRPEGRVAREAREARAARRPRRPRAARRPRPPRRPRASRRPRPSRPPRPARAPRSTGAQTSQWWCFGLRTGGSLYPPPNWRLYPVGVDPNQDHPPWRQTRPWVKVARWEECAAAACRGPFAERFLQIIRRLFGTPEPPPEPPPPRRERRRRQVVAREVALPEAAPPPPFEVLQLWNPYVSGPVFSHPRWGLVQMIAGVEPRSKRHGLFTSTGQFLAESL